MPTFKMFSVLQTTESQTETLSGLTLHRLLKHVVKSSKQYRRPFEVLWPVGKL